MGVRVSDLGVEEVVLGLTLGVDVRRYRGRYRAQVASGTTGNCITDDMRTLCALTSFSTCVSKLDY